MYVREPKLPLLFVSLLSPLQTFTISGFKVYAYACMYVSVSFDYFKVTEHMSSNVLFKFCTPVMSSSYRKNSKITFDSHSLATV